MATKKLVINTSIITLSVLITIFLMKSYSLSSSDSLKKSSKMNMYSDQIDTIEKKVVDLTSPNDLLSVKEFKELLDSGNEYYDLAIVFIHDEKKSNTQKLIVIYSLNKLDFEKYLDFFHICLRLYLNGKLDEDNLLTMLYPGNNWNCLIIKNYKNKKVIKVLEQNMNRVSKNVKEVFDLTLKGILWDSYLNEQSIRFQ